MPLNLPMLQTAIYAAFRKQAVKPGPSKVGTEIELAMDISMAIDAYVRSGTVITGNVDINVGTGLGLAVLPYWPVLAPVFTATTSVGVGTGLGMVV